MVAQNYAEAYRRLRVHEGGNDDDPRDPGGRTSRGILQREWDKYRLTHGSLPADVWQAPETAIADIYRHDYWNVQRCDELPAGVDYAMFDYGVNSGIGRSGKVLRRVVGLSDSSSAVTDEVLAYARVRDPKVLVAAICDERLAFLKALKTWPTFGRGWSTRVAQVREVALHMAAATQGVVPAVVATAIGTPVHLARMNAILGLYEFSGASDNPAILAMAAACGGKIKAGYKHDATAWCALTVNYCLISSGMAGDDSLWALDFAKYAVHLNGPAAGAIATKRRYDANGKMVGGHAFLVVGRTADGKIVGRGGNQSDMVCDDLYDPSVIVSYNWPKELPIPQTGFNGLPVVKPAPHARKDVVLPPASKLDSTGKGIISAPSAGRNLSLMSGTAAGGAAAADRHDDVGIWNWVFAHPGKTAVIAGTVVVVIAGVAYAVNRWHHATFDRRQESPTPDLVPVAA